MILRSLRTGLSYGPLSLLALTAAHAAPLPAGAKVTASGSASGTSPELVADGIVADDSRWLAAESDPSPWVEIAFPEPVAIGAIDIYSGWQHWHAAADFDVLLESGGVWEAPAAGKIRGNTSAALRLPVRGQGISRVKLVLAAHSSGRIRELAVHADPPPPLQSGLQGDKLVPDPVPRDTHAIALNQVGYEAGRAKRFTAPLSPDGSRFEIRPAKPNSTVVFSGTIDRGIGVFTTLEAEGEYVIEVQGGGLKPAASGPFLIRGKLWQDFFWQPAVDFLIDARSVTGTHPSAYGGCPWRDGTYYDAILPALVLLYKADPARIAAMPRQIDWQADKQRVLDPAFKFDAKNPCSEGVMEAVRRYYTEIEPPAADAPDVVKLIHWGAGYYLCHPATKDPSNDPDPQQIHSQTVEQIAYVVWAWPELKQWLPKSFYEKCRNFCEENWAKSLEVDKWWDPATYLSPAQIMEKNPVGGILHPYKGRHAPGHSIVPNLLLHEVAKREGQAADAERYLKAAVAQAAWCVEHLDWSDPRTTKGQRMSEQRTIPGLVWLLRHYPKEAPPGLREKVTEWAKVATARSNNMWDFRRYDGEENWTIPKLNDTGNLAAAPAIFTAASWVVEDANTKLRLKELAVSHADALFGRNPRLAAAASKMDGFSGIERTWPRPFQKNTCARLELCRGSLDSMPGTEMYPFNPEGSYRHAEGWVNYGAAWCISLAYFEFDRRGSDIP